MGKVTGFDLFEDLETLDFVEKTMDTTMLAAELLAKAVCPVKTGECRDSIHIEKHDRFQSDLVADSDHATEVEYGTSKSPAKSFLRRAASEVADL